MRIFIENFNKHSVKINKLLKSYQTSDKFTMIYSVEGIFKITEQNILKLKFLDSPVEKCKNFLDSQLSIIIDRTQIIDEIASQIPIIHTDIFTKVNYYSLHENSKIKYVIEETYDTYEYFDETVIDTICDTNTCYIELPDETNLQDISVRKELNELLCYFK